MFKREGSKQISSGAKDDERFGILHYPFFFPVSEHTLRVCSRSPPASNESCSDAAVSNSETNQDACRSASYKVGKHASTLSSNRCLPDICLRCFSANSTSAKASNKTLEK